VHFAIPENAARNRGVPMRVAAITFVFNESVNLPIWISYFGRIFGEGNLFVVDRGSTDGSTTNLGSVNRIVLPHGAFDETSKTEFIAHLHRGLLYYYDAVIYTDCDELLVPDPHLYSDLSDYLQKSEREYVSCIGLNIQHIITWEQPLNLERPILSQRKYAKFRSAACKTLISRVPIRWLPGFHCCDKPPAIDQGLFLFHLKLMDYSIAMRRQQVNLETVWSEPSLSSGFGAHHRYDYERFVREAFLDPLNMIKQKRISPFGFSSQVAEISKNVINRDGFYLVPNDIVALTEIPDRLRSAF
jgi:hypothetical protein